MSIVELPGLGGLGTGTRIGGTEQAHVTDPRLELGKVIVRGSTLRVQVAEAVTEASISWATDQVTELSLTIEDPGFKIWRTAQFTMGTFVLYRNPPLGDVRFRITALDLGPGAGGTGGFDVKCRSEGAWKLKRRRGPLVMPKATPSQFVAAEAKACGLNAIVQPSASRTQVARDVPKEGEEAQRGSQRPSSWTTFQRLAGELGYYVFEFGGTVYFGQPSWLIARTKDPVKIVVPFKKPIDERYAALSIPNIAMSEDADVPVEITGIEVPRARFWECAPGKTLELHGGLSPFHSKYLITSMSMPMLGPGSVSLTAKTPIDPEPQPPEEPEARRASSSSGSSGGSSGGGGSATQSGTKSALDFVNVAMTQNGDRYIFGAEARLSDANPGAFDCSELIEWALARVGVKFVDGSANQIAACRQISVAQALRTRGALVYAPGHIGISLGDGRTFEARNSRVGVRVFGAGTFRWTRGGLVPGLRYG